MRSSPNAADHNVQGIIQGSLDTELNDVGIAQAERTGQVLDQTGVQIVKAWTSDLKRASKVPRKPRFSSRSPY